jgi:hypothetical protein
VSDMLTQDSQALNTSLFKLLPISRASEIKELYLSSKKRRSNSDIKKVSFFGNAKVMSAFWRECVV